MVNTPNIMAAHNIISRSLSTIKDALAAYEKYRTKIKYLI